MGETGATNSALKDREDLGGKNAGGLGEYGDIGELRITGVMISYYFICQTKLWLFAHNITMEHENENVRIGKEIHKSSYNRENKEIELPGIKLDFLKRGKKLEVHEVKKSKKMKDADRYQVLYYLYELHKRGVEAIGVLNYPLIREILKIEPSEEDFIEMEGILRDIKRIVSGPYIPPVYKKICRKCAYFEFCFGGIG